MVEVYFPPEFLGRAVIPDAVSKEKCAEDYLKSSGGGENEFIKANAAVLQLATDMFFGTFDEDEYIIECAGNGQDQLRIALCYGGFEKQQLIDMKEDEDFRAYWTDRYRSVLLDFMDVAGIIFEKVLGDAFDVGVMVLDKNGEVVYAVTDYGIRNDYLFQECTFSGEELSIDLLQPAPERKYFPDELVDKIPAIDPAETENERILEIPCRITEYENRSVEELLDEFFVEAQYNFEDEIELSIENFMTGMVEDKGISVDPFISSGMIHLDIRFEEFLFSDFSAMRESENYRKEFKKFWNNYLSSLKRVTDKAGEIYRVSKNKEIDSIMLTIKDKHGLSLYLYHNSIDWDITSEEDYLYENYK